MFPQWFLFALISVCGLVLAELSQRVSMKKVEDISAEANNFIVWLIIGLVGLLSSIVTGQLEFHKLELIHVLYFIIIGSIYFWGGKLFYSSYKGISATVGSTLMTFSVIVSTTLGIVLLNENFNIIKVAGVIFVIAAIFTLNYSRDFKPNRYMFLALAGAAIYGFAYTMDKFIVLKLNPYFYMFLFALSIALMSLVFSFKTIYKDLSTKAKPANYKVMLLAGLCFSIFNLFTFKAYSSGGDVGVLDAINNTSVFGILLLEYLVFKERTKTLRNLIAAIFAVFGVILLIINT